MEHFEEYKKQGEPEKSQKAENWGVAIGLQQVDNLTTSKYLIEIAICLCHTLNIYVTLWFAQTTKI